MHIEEMALGHGFDGIHALVDGLVVKPCCSGEKQCLELLLGKTGQGHQNSETTYEENFGDIFHAEVCVCSNKIISPKSRQVL